jgi:hypothetical protein
MVSRDLEVCLRQAAVRSVAVVESADFELRHDSVG